jgi:hypothetical protein
VSDHGPLRRSVWNQSPNLLNQLVTHARKPKSYPSKLKPPRSLNKLRRRISPQSSDTNSIASRDNTPSPRSFLDAESIREVDDEDEQERTEREEQHDDVKGEEDDAASRTLKSASALELEPLRTSPVPVEDHDEGEYGRRQRTKSDADARSMFSTNSLAEKRRKFFGLSSRSTGSLNSSGTKTPKKVGQKAPPSPLRVCSRATPS